MRDMDFTVGPKNLESNEEFSFSVLQKKLNSSMLPPNGWGYLRGDNKIVGFQKIENDYRVRKRVIVYPDLRIKILEDENVLPLSEHIIIVSMEQLTAILKMIDEDPLEETE